MMWLTLGAIVGALLCVRFAWRLAAFRLARATHKTARATVPVARRAKWTAFKLAVGAGFLVAIVYLLMVIGSVLDVRRDGEPATVPAKAPASPTHPEPRPR